MQKVIKLLFVCIMITATVFTAGCAVRTADSKIAVKTYAAAKVSLPIKVNIAGTLVPSQTVNVSSKVSGQIETLNVDAGSAVNAGDILITLDKKDLNAQLAQAQAAYDAAKNKIEQDKVNENADQTALSDAQQKINAAVSKAKIDLDSAKKDLDRAQALFNQGAEPQSFLDAAQSKYDSANNGYTSASGSDAQSQIDAAQSKYDLDKRQYDTDSTSGIEQAQAAVNTIQVQLSDTVITAPISGTITNKNINQGEVVAPGAALLTIADTNTLKLKGTIPQEVIPFVQLGQDIKVSVDILSGSTFDGTITSIGPVAASTGEYFPIEMSITNNGKLSAGLSAHAVANFTLDGQIAVPNSAVVKNNGESYLFTVKGGIASKKMVKLGLSNDTDVAVLSGVDAGENIAVTNANNLFDNMPVSIDTSSK